jgi:hypothetical protein
VSARYWVLVSDELMASLPLWLDGFRPVKEGNVETPGMTWHLFEDDDAPEGLEGKRVEVIVSRDTASPGSPPQLTERRVMSNGHLRGPGAMTPEEVAVRHGARKILRDYADPPEGGTLVPRGWVEENRDALEAWAQAEDLILGDTANWKPTGFLNTLPPPEVLK